MNKDQQQAIVRAPRSCGMKEAARYLGVPVKTLYNWKYRGLFTCRQIGIKILIDYAELDRLLERHTIPAQDEYQGSH